MSLLKNELQNQIPNVQNEIKQLIADKGDKKISDVTVAQSYSGMRCIKAFVCDTSSVSADKGLIVRGIPLLDITHILPEEVFFLLLTGRLPEESELVDLKKDFSTDDVNTQSLPNIQGDKITLQRTSLQMLISRFQNNPLSCN